MAADNKEIKFKFVVDDQSFTAFLSKIQQAAQQVAALSSQVNTLNNQLHGGAGGGGGAAGTVPNPLGGGPVLSTNLGRMPGSTPGAGSTANISSLTGLAQYGANSMLSQISQTKGVFESLSKMSGDAIKNMSSVLRDEIGKSSREIVKLRGDIEGLLATMRSTASSKFPALHAFDSEELAGKVRALRELEARSASMGGLADMLEGGPPGSGPPGGGGGGGGFFGGRRRMMAGVGRVLSGDFDIGSELLGGSLLGGAAAVAAAGYFGFETGNRISRGITNFQIEQESIKTYDAQRFRDVNLLQTGAYNQAARAMRHGSVKYLAAERDLQKDPVLSKYAENVVREAEANERITQLQHLADAKIIGQEVLTTYMAGGALGESAAANLDQDRIRAAGTVARLNVAAQVAEANPKNYADIYDLFRDTAAARAGAMRVLGTSYRKDKKTGQITPYSEELNKYRDRGISEETVFGIHQTIEQIAGRQAAGNLRAAGVNANVAGLYGGATMAGLGAVYSTQGGGSFLDAIMHYGNDVGVANKIGAMAAKGLTTGPMTSGMGFLGMTQMFMGGSSAEEMRIANQLEASADPYARLFQGQMDPFQTGINTVNAIKAAPGASIYGQDYLATKISLPKMADMLASGTVPQYLANMGITFDSVQKYFNLTLESQSARHIYSGKNTPDDVLAAQIRSAHGDVKSLLRQGQAGLEGDRLKDFNKQFVESYAGFLESKGYATDYQKAMGLSQTILGFGNQFTRGKGFGDPARGTAELDQTKLNNTPNRALDDFLKNKQADGQTGVEKLKETLSQAPAAAAGYEKIGSLAQSAAQADEALRELTTTIRILTEEADRSGRVKAEHLAQEAKDPVLRARMNVVRNPYQPKKFTPAPAAPAAHTAGQGSPDKFFHTPGPQYSGPPGKK